MSKLLDVLFEETKSLKVQYIGMTKEWATQDFERFERINHWDNRDWCKYFGIECVERTQSYSGDKVYYVFPVGFYNTAKAKTYSNLRDLAYRVVGRGINDYVDGCVNKAEMHYSQSIQKLAFRIAKKGLNIDKLKTTRFSGFCQAISAIFAKLLNTNNFPVPAVLPLTID